MPRRRSPRVSEHSQRESERKELERAERKARGNRLYAVLAWRPDGRYSGRDVWRWFRREADADRWASGFHRGQGVAVRAYTMLNDADAEWIPERAARLVAEFLGPSADPARPHAAEKSVAQLEREIDQALAQPELSKLATRKSRTLEHVEADARARMRPGALEDAMTKARAQVARSNHRQSIWMTREGELRVRPMFETVSPLWFFVRHVPSDDELRV